MRQRLAILTIAVAAAAGALPAVIGSGARSMGSIRGTVTDPSGAAIPHARVTLRGPGMTETLMTDGSGQYDATALAPGHYSLLVRANGFAKFQRPGLVVVAGEQSEADAPLGLRPLRQVVTVHAARS